MLMATLLWTQVSGQGCDQEQAKATSVQRLGNLSAIDPGYVYQSPQALQWKIP